MDVGSVVVLFDDGHGIYWICLAIWTNVVVGSDGDYQFGIGLAESGTILGGMVVGRILGG